jgi:tetratricopeptide (TPR) repeat protein
MSRPVRVARTVLLYGVAALGACAHPASEGAGAPATAPAAATAAPRAAGGPDVEIVLGQGAREGGPRVTAAWVAYGGSKAGAFLVWRRPPANDAADDFELELAARSAQSEYWSASQQEADAQANPLLDRQAEIWRAGFLPELVAAIYARPGWTIPPKTIAALRLEEFARRFPGRYASGAPVALKTASGKLVPDVPGADFPDPETLPYGPASCPLALDARRAAWERWAALEPRLGGAPVGAETTLDFAHQLVVMKRDPARVARGATWVAARVAHLAALEGFCAIEAKDWPRAAVLLQRAVSLRPASPNPRLELSMALMMLGRRNEALAVADEIRSFSDDGCAVAAAWRRRGYILIDLGDLAGARDAYERSILLEPDSAIAQQELASIAAVVRANPAANTRTAAPPSASDIRVTGCHRQ